MSKEGYRLNNWLAQSGIPQKTKEIGGVSRTTVVDLKAQTEKVKVQAQGIKDGSMDPGDRRKRGIDLSSLGPSNSGVKERDDRDKVLQLKEKKHTNWTPEMEQALAKKAETYDMLQSGQLNDDEGLYEVDFMRKGGSTSGRAERDGDWAAAGSRQEWEERGRGEDAAAMDTTGLAVSGTGGMRSADMDRERERRQWEQQEDNRTQADERKRQYKETVLDIHEDALDGQDEARQRKREREAHDKARLEVFKHQIVQNRVKQMMQQRATEAVAAVAAAAVVKKKKKKRAAAKPVGTVVESALPPDQELRDEADI